MKTWLAWFTIGFLLACLSADVAVFFFVVLFVLRLAVAFVRSWRKAARRRVRCSP